MDTNEVKFFDNVVNSYNGEPPTEELVFKFNCWFSNLLCEVRRTKDGSYITLGRTIDEIAELLPDTEIEFMCEVAGWFSEAVFGVDKRNAIYWYALHLLYLYDDTYNDRAKEFCDEEEQDNYLDFFDYDALFTFLNGLTPFEK